MLYSATFNYVDHEREEQIARELFEILKKLKKSQYYEYLNYILKEIVSNANKANLKRAYFIKKGLDIDSDSDYLEGIENFRDAISIYTDELFEIIEENGLNIDLEIKELENNLLFVVRDNNQLLPVEKTRIEDRIKMAKKFNSMDEVLSGALDTTEGGGFGLILVVLMLRNLGLDEHMIKIGGTEISTEISIVFPSNLLDQSKGNIIADVIVNEIKDIPQFPQHIMTLMSILNDPNRVFDEISEIIKKDSAMIADLLKLANSTMYMLPKRVKTIEEAVRLIGLSAIKNLVITYTSRKLLMNKYNLKVINDIMKHSQEVAFYAYELTKLLNLKNVVDDTYVAAMLHDFGKIIVQSINPDNLEKIQKICTSKGINNFVVESLTNSYNHSIIGALLAEKWDFPEVIIQSIKYHHIPLEAIDKYQPQIFVLYLANSLYYYKRGNLHFKDLNFHILSAFDIYDNNEFEKLAGPIIVKLNNDEKE